MTLPTAAPYLFTGLRIASSLAVISALVAEYFGGPIGGLGKSITSAASSSNYPLAWAYVLGAIVLGLVFYCVALLAEVVATRHQPAPDPAHHPTPDREMEEPMGSPKISRRTMLGQTGLAAAAVGLTLAGCGGSAEPPREASGSASRRR